MSHNTGHDGVSPVRDTPLFTLVNTAVCATAAIAVAADWVTWAVTFTPWARHLPSAVFVPFFVLMFPLFGWSVWLLSRTRRQAGARRGSADLLAAIPRGGQVLVALAVAAAVVSFAWAGAALGGQPEYDPATHQYVLNNHGNLTTVSRADYLHALAVQDRLFLGAALVFTSAALGITYGYRARHGSAGFPLRRWPRPARPRPPIPVPGPVLALIAAAALAGATAGGLVIIDRLYAWTNDAIYLHAGRPVAAPLAPGNYTVFVGCTQDMSCPRVAPGAVTVRGASGAVNVLRDPSSDHDSGGDGTSDGAAYSYVGELSFVIPRAGAVQIELTAAPGEPVFVTLSEGQEARSLAGWIALAGAGLLILLASLVPLGWLAWWRLTPPLRQDGPYD